jgi:hypothetical protein
MSLRMGEGGERRDWKSKDTVQSGSHFCEFICSSCFEVRVLADLAGVDARQLRQSQEGKKGGGSKVRGFSSCQRHLNV